MQHCDHVSAYYWHLSKQPGELAQAEALYWAAQDYGLASKMAMHAKHYFRH